MLNVMVIFGGKSVEHDISIITGVLTTNVLDGVFNAIPVYISKNGEWFYGESLKNLSFFKSENLKKCKRASFKTGQAYLFELKGNKIKGGIKIDCAVNCTHGVNGEDGMLSGVMQSLNIPISSPDAFCSAVTMDKERTKMLLKGLKIKSLPYFTVLKGEGESGVIDKAKKLGFPLIVKPSNLGSSIGIVVTKDEEELINGLENAFKYDDKVVVEKALSTFTEINCAVCFNGERFLVSECEKPIAEGEILSFSDKYQKSVEREFPAKIDYASSEKIKKISLEIYKQCGFRGIIRIDFLLVDGRIYVNEINSVPGSLAYYLFCDTFSDFSLLMEKIVKNAIKEHAEKNGRCFKFSSDVLFGEYNNKK